MKQQISVGSTILANVIQTGSLAPILGLDCPLQSTALVPVTTTGKVILSRSERLDKQRDVSGKVIKTTLKKEYTLVGGKAESQKPGDVTLLDYSDFRFIENGNQISAEECAKVLFESPISCLSREAIEELTGFTKDKNPKEFDSACKTFGWLIEKIYQSRDWEFLKSKRDVVLDEKTGEILKEYSTYTGICRVILSDQEISRLNQDINSFKNNEFQEHKEVRPFDWSIEDVSVEGKKPYRALVVHVGDDFHVRKYNKDVLFRYYHNEFSRLINKNRD